MKFPLLKTSIRAHLSRLTKFKHHFKIVFVISLVATIAGCTNNGTGEVINSGTNGNVQPNISELHPVVEPSEINLKEQVNIEADVVLIGSEIEGAYLAHAAKVEGLEVIIIDPREKVGGQVIQGQMLFLDEPGDASGKTLLQGNVKILFDEFKAGRIRQIDEFQLYYDNLLNGVPIDSGIEIVNIETIDTEDARQAIKSVTYKDSTGIVKKVTADYWVENTDFAYLSSQLETSKLPGVETIFKLKEEDYMAASLMMKFKNVDWKVFQEEVNKLSEEEKTELYGSTTFVTNTFTWGFGNVGKRYTPTRSDVFLRGLNTLNQNNGEALINALLIYDVDPSDPERVKEAVEIGRAETELVLEHLRKELPGWENAELNDLPEYLYIRDYKRFETEYVLTATDLLSGKMYWDNVSIGGYPLDVQGTINHQWGVSLGYPDKYGMPLRSFVLKNYDNVVVAGKNVGATAPAYGSARIQPNTSLAGQVIGIIMGQTHDQVELLDITEEHMLEIQNYIVTEYGIDIKEKEAINKIEGFTEEELEKINMGHLQVSK